MITKVQKWGHSLAVRIPRAAAEDAQLRPGREVQIAIRGGRLVLTPARRRFKLANLLRGMTRRNRHAEVSTGDAVGREAW